jgi:hypothetical protein
VAVELTAKPISTQAIDAVTEELGGRGFKRRKAVDVLTIDLAEGVLGWIGLNRATKHYGGAAVEINPVVGVRHQRVERLVAELRGETFHEYVPPTVSRPLGYLMPSGRYEGWLFEAASVNAKAAALSNAIADYGLPVMRSISGLDELRRKIEESWGFSHQLVYRLPVVRWLEGDESGAINALDASAHELGDRNDPAAGELRSFIRAFRARISSDG